MTTAAAITTRSRTRSTRQQKGPDNGENQTPVEPPAKDTTKKTTTSAGRILIPAPEVGYVQCILVAQNDLVCNRFSEDAKAALMMAGRKKVRGERDPERQFNAARYRIREGLDGFPCILIKRALISATSFHGKDVTKALAASMFVMPTEKNESGVWLAPLLNEANQPLMPRMREDVVCVGGTHGHRSGKADLRWRPEYSGWRIPVTIQFPEDRRHQEGAAEAYRRHDPPLES